MKICSQNFESAKYLFAFMPKKIINVGTQIDKEVNLIYFYKLNAENVVIVGIVL